MDDKGFEETLRQGQEALDGWQKLRDELQKVPTMNDHVLKNVRKRLDEDPVCKKVDEATCAIVDRMTGAILDRMTERNKPQAKAAAPDVNNPDALLPRDEARRIAIGKRVAKKLKDPAGYPTMTIQEAAQALSRSDKTIYRMVEDGRLESTEGKPVTIFTESVNRRLKPSLTKR
jgi:hypothetical protein